MYAAISGWYTCKVYCFVEVDFLLGKVVSGKKPAKNSYRCLKQVDVLDEYIYNHHHDLDDHVKDDHHLVDVKVEALLHPALRLLELLLQVHYLIKKMAMKINNRIGDGHDDSHSQKVTSIDQQMVMNLRSDHNH